LVFFSNGFLCVLAALREYRSLNQVFTLIVSILGIAHVRDEAA